MQLISIKMPKPKSAANKKRVRNSAKDRVQEKNEQVVNKLLIDLTNEKAAAEQLAARQKAREETITPYKPDESIIVARITKSQGGDTFTIKPVQGDEMQVRVLGNAALSDTIAQVCKNVAHAAQNMWPLVVVQVPINSSTRKTGEIIGVLDGTKAELFGKLGFKIPEGSADEEDMFDRDSDIDIDVI